MEMLELNRVYSQLSEFVEAFAPHLGRTERRHWCKVYLSGLLLNGKRKSIQSIAERIEGGNEQALQQFVNQSPWSYGELLKGLRRFFSSHFSPTRSLYILHNKMIPKKGRHSVGVVHQCCGVVGKLSNCQCLVTWQGSTEAFHMPLAARLYLPVEWVKDSKRMEQAGVPKDQQVYREKWKIALDLLDDLHSEMTPSAIVLDACYGSNREFLQELDNRKLFFVAEIREKDMLWDGTAEAAMPHPTQEKGYPWIRARMQDRRRILRSALEWGRLLFSDPRNIKSVNIPLQSEKAHLIASMPVYESIARTFHRVGPRRRLLVEKMNKENIKFYISNLPTSISETDILCKAHVRWKAEQEFNKLNGELGLGHFEGRSWTGLHHHIALCFMAYDFLQLLRLETDKKQGSISVLKCPITIK